MSRNLRCIICNSDAPFEGEGWGVFLTLPADWTGHLQVPAYVVHKECAERAAHPEFDFATDAMGRPSRFGPDE